MSEIWCQIRSKYSCRQVIIIHQCTGVRFGQNVDVVLCPSIAVRFGPSIDVRFGQSIGVRLSQNIDARFGHNIDGMHAMSEHCCHIRYQRRCGVTCQGVAVRYSPCIRVSL